MTVVSPLPRHAQMPVLYAGFWRRVAAWFIDFFVLSAIEWILLMALGGRLLVPWTALGPWEDMGEPGRFFDGAVQPFGILVVWFYYALCESSRAQATVGKLALGLQVTDEYGARIGFARATGRYFGMYVSAFVLCVGFMLAGWTPRKQALHDLMAACCVVRRAGLDAWRRDAGGQPAPVDASAAATPAYPASARVGMPGWAIALIVFAGSFFLVLPLVAVLVAIAIPAYASYTVRTQVAQGVAFSGRTRSLVAEYIGRRGALPDSNDVLGLPRPDAVHARYVASIMVTGGQVVVTYGGEASPAIRGGHVVMSPSGNAARMRWQCSSPDIRAIYLPADCRR
ncbi:MAG: RDD family protein [Rhodanobacteraceae bacterium]